MLLHFWWFLSSIQFPAALGIRAMTKCFYLLIFLSPKKLNVCNCLSHGNFSLLYIAHTGDAKFSHFLFLGSEVERKNYTKCIFIPKHSQLLVPFIYLQITLPFPPHIKLMMKIANWNAQMCENCGHIMKCWKSIRLYSFQNIISL